MHQVVLGIVLASILPACGPSSQVVSTSKNLAQYPMSYDYDAVPGTQDVFIVRGAAPAAIAHVSSTDPAACRAHIAATICLADEVGKNCQSGGEAYAAQFEALFDRYPPQLQRMFCSVQKLWVLENFGATAFAGMIRDADGHMVGAEMGIRRSVLDERLNLQTWSTWKEDLSFGGVVGTYVGTPGLPATRTKSPDAINDFLYAVVTHEFGHMFDFANSLNGGKAAMALPRSMVAPSRFPPGSWGALSWIDDETVREEFRFPYRKGLCFYACNGEPMSASAAPQVYRGLARTNFISTYAATNPWDDFAESLAYTMMDQNLGSTYEVLSGQGESYDMMMKLRGPLFATKRQYITDFFARPTIVYP